MAFLHIGARNQGCVGAWERVGLKAHVLRREDAFRVRKVCKPMNLISLISFSELNFSAPNCSMGPRPEKVLNDSCAQRSEYSLAPWNVEFTSKQLRRETASLWSLRVGTAGA